MKISFEGDLQSIIVQMEDFLEFHYGERAIAATDIHAALAEEYGFELTDAECDDILEICEPVELPETNV